jgi:antirestriction protein ArdC
VFDDLRARLFAAPVEKTPSADIPERKRADVSTNKNVVASILQEVKDAFRSPTEWIKNFSKRGRTAPVNPLSGEEYKAFNLVALSAAADKAGFSDPRWLSKKEAENNYGASLKPDAVPTRIAVPVLHSYEDENGNKFESVRFQPVDVYNAEQFSGMPTYEEPETVKYTPKEAFEVILDRFNRAEIERRRSGAPSILGMKIDDGSVNPDTGKPIRSPNYSRDRIKLPLRSQFKSDEAWIQSLAHELIHSTGASFRQNRPETQEARTDSTQRAREEVIAEMASAMLMKTFGLDYDTRNSAAYIKTQALNEGLTDEDILDASIKAQAAIDYMLGNDVVTMPKWDPSTTKRPQTPTEFRNTELTPLQSSINPDTSQASIEALSLPELSLDQEVSSSDKAKQKVYDALIEKLKKLGTGNGKLGWTDEVPWRTGFRDGFEFTGGSGLPRNPSSKRLYSGFNSFWLKIVSMSDNYTDSRWMTYNQAKDMGGQVRLGEKGVPILVPVKFMVTKDKEGKPLLDKNGKETGFSKLFFKTATVFNVAQIDGLDLPDDKPSTDMTPVEAQDFIIDRYTKSMEAKGLKAPVIDFSYVGDYSDHASSPNWSPFDDRITLPSMAQFESPEAVFDTLMHELTHSTGHIKRLDRSDLTRDYANPNQQARAQEELIAEMGAAILGEMFGVNYSVDNTQAYMQSWFGALRNGDANILQIAASKAQQAVDYMLGMDLGDWSPLDGYNTYLGKQGQEGDEE